MNRVVLNATVRDYRGRLYGPAVRCPGDTYVGGVGGADMHVGWMLDQISDLDDAKAMRWLCFVQGVLWTLGRLTIDEAREHNSAILKNGDDLANGAGI